MGLFDCKNALPKQSQSFSLLAFIGVLIGMMVFIGHFDDLRADEKLVQYGDAEKVDPPLRKVSIIATPEGFYPEHFSAYVGERVKFFVTSTTDMPSCLILKGKEVFLEAKRGEVQEAEVFIQRPGTFKYYCPQGKIEGQMTVLEHPKKVRERRQQRGLASEKKVKMWTPQDE